MARRRGSRARRRAQQPGKLGGITLNTVALTGFLFFVLIFALTFWLSQYASYNQIRMQQRTAGDAVVLSVAYQLSSAVESYATSLESMARDPELVNLIKSGDAAALKKRADELSRSFPYALALRIFRRGTAHLDNSVKPPIGYACLDLINSVERGDMMPAIEVHAPNTPQQHVEIVRPVLDQGRPVGVLQLALNVKVLNSWMRDVARNLYVELVQQTGDQASILLAKAGDGDLRNALSIYHEVQGTRWKVAVTTAALTVLATYFAFTYLGLVFPSGIVHWAGIPR